MKLALPILATLLLLGCSSERAYRPPAAPDPPVSPPPTASSLTSVWAMVIEDSGLCIVDATVQVVGGQGLGQKITQSEPCDAWSEGGVFFDGLTPGVEMTLRASASGYAVQEKTVVPHLGLQSAVQFALSRIQ